MIRINLLPVKAAKRREVGQRQILGYAAVVALALGGIVVYHSWAAADLASQRSELGRLRTEIDQLKSEVGDYDAIKRQRDDLRKQKDAIERLQNARSGPVFLMRELSDILTRGKGPSVKREQYEEIVRKDPNAGFNAEWESRRAWIVSYAEKGGVVVLKGGAKSDEDVAEFLKRLKLSAFFSDVYWQQTQPQADAKSGVTYVTFDVTCRVNY